MARFDWTPDELILALDLYFKEPGAIGSKSHPAVHELSAVLNNLPIHPALDRNEHFRNPNGVGMKLANFLRFDSSYTGKGLNRGNKYEEQIWNEFAHDLPRLRKVSDAIRRAVASGEIDSLAEEEEIADAAEGRVLTKLHRYRERSQKLVKLKKATVLTQTGALECEVCRFDFSAVYGERGDGFAECHHMLPLEQLTPGSKTKLGDLAIVCSNCHRMIHAKRPWLNLDELRELREQSMTGVA